jgi:site-specific DNA-methyltransferase (adenine-specific)
MQPLSFISPVISAEGGLREVYQSKYGILYQEDCLNFLGAIPDYCADIVFADPPFNLGKDYGNGASDLLKSSDYLAWSKQWLKESIRVL